jgi:axial budding pattern protein 2
MALWGALFIASHIIVFSNANPVISFPLNSQVPPVARVSIPFSFTFSSSTFSSPLTMSYTLSSGPSWLSLDGATRTLFGTPEVGDIGQDSTTGVVVGLTATDATGSTTLNATLVVSGSLGPTIVILPSAQLFSMGMFSAPSTLLYHPSTPFKFSFDPNTFGPLDHSSTFSYYAVTADNTPLPSWILFDGSSLSFNGQTPDYQSLIQPPQIFTIQLIASDVQGFAGVSLFFEIEVGIHLLAFKDAHLALNGTAGEEFSYNELLGNIQLDGKEVARASITSVMAELPSWLAIDDSTLRLSGTIPVDGGSANFSIQITDIYGNIAKTLVSINIPLVIFNAPLIDLSVAAGRLFSFDLGAYISNISDTTITVQFAPLVKWISFDTTSFLVTGQVPLFTDALIIVVSLHAASKSRHTLDSRSFNVMISPAVPTYSSSSSSPSFFSSRAISAQTTALTPTATETGSLGATQPLHPKHVDKKMIMMILIPIGTIISGVILVLVSCWWRRRTRKASNYAVHPSKHDISAPLEASSSYIYSIGTQPCIAQPHQPLQLDMSGFGETRRSIIAQEKPKLSTTLRGAEIVRWPKTISTNPPRERSRAREPDSSVSQPQDYVESLLSRTEAIPSKSRAHTEVNSLKNDYLVAKRLTHNHSRKSDERIFIVGGDNIRPTVVGGGGLAHHDGRPQFASGEVPGTPHRGGAQEKPNHAQGDNHQLQPPSVTRHSRFKLVLVRRVIDGTSHQGTNPVVSANDTTTKYSSIAFSQDRALHHGPRNNENTTDVTEVNSCKRGSTSSTSDYGDTRTSQAGHRSTVRQVTKSPNTIDKYHLGRNANWRHSRPVGRASQSSPFFGGSSFRVSRRRSVKKTRISYADSPTVPEGSAIFRHVVGSVPQVLCEESHDKPSRNSSGVTYGIAQEGTRKLRSYIKSQMLTARSKRNTQLHRPTSSKDSSFTATSGPLNYHHMQRHRSSNPRVLSGPHFDNYIVSELSEESWETQDERSDSENNISRYYTDIEENSSRLPRSTRPELATQTSQSISSSSAVLDQENGVKDRDLEEQMVVGFSGRLKGVNPTSLEEVNRGQRGEMDYTAYI